MQRSRRTVETGKEPIAGRLDDAAVVSLDRVGEDAVVVREDRLPTQVADLLRDHRGPDDVGEQQGRQHPLTCGRLTELGCPAGDVDHDHRLVPDDDGVVAGGHDDDMPSHHVEDLAIVHLDAHVARYHDASVGDLTAARARDRAHVRRPPPARRGGVARREQVTDPHRLDEDARELATLVGLIEALGAGTRTVHDIHRAPSRADTEVGT